MSQTGEIIAQSLEVLAERVGDPAPQVYARLFAAYPEMEALFVRDTTGAVRGEMLAMAFQCLMDLDGAYAVHMIAAERVNHDAFGVPHEVFGRFFPLLADTCRALSGEAWTAEVEAAWAQALARIGELTPIGAQKKRPPTGGGR